MGSRLKEATMEQLLLAQAIAGKPHLMEHRGEWVCPLCDTLLDAEVAGSPGSRYHAHEEQVAARLLQLAIDEHLAGHSEVDK
jgi:hypothetical protein